MSRTATDPLTLAAEEADAEAAAAEAEAHAAQASASAARARARAARLRREAGGSDEYSDSETTSTPEVTRDPAESDRASSASGSGTSESSTPTTGSAAKTETAGTPGGAAASGTTADSGAASRTDRGSTAVPELEADVLSGTDTDSGIDTPARAEPRIELDSETSNPEPPAAAATGRRAGVRQLPNRIAAVVTAAGRRVRSIRVRRPRLATVGRLLVVVVVLAAVAAGTYSIWNHRQLAADQARADEYLGAAREGVVALTTLDSARAGEDVQRILDHSAGAFRTDFQSRAEDFTKVVEQSQVATEGEITAAAVESTTDDSAVVLVSAVSKVTNSAGAEQEPRIWRLSVTVSEGDEGLKMSKVEFVP